MGFNISGLVVNKSYKDKIKELEKDLKWNLSNSEDITFETASSNWKDEEFCDIYFSDQGTLIFLSMDKCTEAFPILDKNTLTFALSETSMAFNINYCEKGVEKRSIMEVEGDRMNDEGEKLSVEDKSEDASEIIWNQIEVVLGKRFWDIDPDEKSYRFRFTSDETTEDQKPDSNLQSGKQTEDQIKYDFSQPLGSSVFKEQMSDDELKLYFEEQIRFAQNKDINIFLHPWAHGENSKRYFNFYNLIKEISVRPTVLSEVKKMLPIADRLDMFCKFDPDKVDKKTEDNMMKYIKNIRFSSKIESNRKSIIQKDNGPISQKKWWQFWK